MKIKRGFVVVLIVSLVIFFVGIISTLNLMKISDLNKLQKQQKKYSKEKVNDESLSLENIENDQNIGITKEFKDIPNNLEEILSKLEELNNNNKSNKIKTKLPRFNKLNNPFNRIDLVYKRNKEKNIERAEMVKESMKFAWDSYKKNAWGKDEWLPTENYFSDWLGGYGLTIIDSLDTLMLMDLNNELNDAKKFLEELFINKNIDSEISVFEANIRYLGATLTMYDYTGEDVYYNKAKEFGELLMHSFTEESPLPASYLKILTKSTRDHDGFVVLAPLGSMSLEFARLSDITGDPKYKDKIDGIINAMEKLHDEATMKGLLYTLISKNLNSFGNQLISIGGMGDSYYEYLLKMWIYTDGEEEIYRRLFEDSADSIIKYLYKVLPNGNGYIGNFDYGSFVQRQEHLTCFAGGMFALAAAANITGNDEKNKIYMKIGKEVTKTCTLTYLESPIGLGPEVISFKPDGTFDYQGGITIPWYLLRPETVESLFILYRLTGDPIYQEWGWEIYQAIEKHCRIENGYVGYKDINYNFRDTNQQSFFMAETLKYLYLLFKDSNTVPLDKYVLNTEAHPLLIKYRNN